MRHLKRFIVDFVLIIIVGLLMFTFYSQLLHIKETILLDKTTQSVVQLKQENIDLSGELLVANIKIQKLEREKAELVKQLDEKKLKLLTINNNDIDLLSRLIYAEARSSEKGMKYVGEVVLNRVDSPYYAKTIKDVIYEKGQFAVIRDGQINLKPTKMAINIATQLISKTIKRELPKNILAFRAQRYHRGKNYVDYCSVGGNYFSIVR